MVHTDLICEHEGASKPPHRGEYRRDMVAGASHRNASSDI